MAVNDWVFDIETKIYTIIKTRLEKALKTTYPSLYVAQQEKLNDTPQFPTVILQILSSPEIGSDLNNTTVNAMLVTWEAHITVSKAMGLSGLRKVSAEVLDNFKKLRFNTTDRGTINRETSDTYTTISRFRRVIGGNEEINF